MLNTRTALKEARFAFDIVEVPAVPEMSSLSMFGLGAVASRGGLGLRRRLFAGTGR